MKHVGDRIDGRGTIKGSLISRSYSKHTTIIGANRYFIVDDNDIQAMRTKGQGYADFRAYEIKPNTLKEVE